MKAISPVIATLILIAIAVIAGIFVLRQFLLFAGTSGTQNVLTIQDAILYKVTKNLETGGYIHQIYLQISVKNNGDKVAELHYIKVDDILVYNYTAESAIRLNPGQVQSLTKYVTTVTDDQIDQWQAGTEHVVSVTYQILGQAGEQTISQKITVQ